MAWQGNGTPFSRITDDLRVKERQVPSSVGRGGISAPQTMINSFTKRQELFLHEKKKTYMKRKDCLFP